MTRSLQETYAPHGRCFGCGPANDQGLRIRSIPAVDAVDAHVLCDFVPARHHEAFENVLNGGIIGTVLDCHMNWTTIFHLMKKNGLDHAPCCVTADFKVTLKRPTPTGPIHVEAKVVESTEDRATIAPSTKPIAHSTPANQCSTAATAHAVNTTQPTARSPIGRKLNLNSRQLIATPAL